MTDEEIAAKKLADDKAAAEAAERQKLAESELFKKAVEEAAAEKLKEIKAKLDGAYSTRDELAKKLKEKEDADRAAELKRLQDEGKHREAYDLQMKELNEKNERLAAQNIELTRNVEVRSALSALEFRSDNAREMAFKEITGDLIRDEKGVWVHKTGVPIAAFVKSFSEDVANEFLFKPKANSGAGAGGGGGNNNAGAGGKSLFEMSQADVLKLAAEGKLPNQRK